MQRTRRDSNIWGALITLLLLTSLVACTEPGDTEVADDDDDTGVIEDGDFVIQATVSDVITTVITVEWSVDLDDIDGAYVEFGPDET